MTATALGLTFPQSPLSTADEAIEQALRNAAIYGSEMTLWVRLCRKSRFALMVKNSAGYRRGFRVKM